ncbi:glutaminase [Formosa algae]|uniref:Glutaminase n=1 Tax=Formosa algae TaxID=225843 RepID=A0A9X0YPB7_9FLAO|nr:glutaminase [Formosa algae]MBP1840681.1 glutaminase [Formosa algae]MDQ0335906.1 glutaminase [Formosa algae]OEI81194.1 glutaminase [Formosa algae]
MNFKDIITDCFNQVKGIENEGHLAAYIPELANIDPEKFGVHITTMDQQGFGMGDALEKFSIQSIAKVLSLVLAYKILGKKIWERVDVEPSGNAFNSLLQLEVEHGIPRNPFINAGALVISDILVSELDHPKQDFLEFVRRISNNPNINYCSKIAESEKKVGYRNIALCNFIKSLGNINNEPDEVLDFYFNLCSLEMNCKELSELFLFLANNGCCTYSKEEILTERQSKRINALMQTCGFYDESGEFAFEVGLPGKSGVGGGIVAVHPDQYTIAVWSPKLNKNGNSFKGMKFLEAFTTESKLSIF